MSVYKVISFACFVPIWVCRGWKEKVGNLRRGTFKLESSKNLEESLYVIQIYFVYVYVKGVYEKIKICVYRYV